MKYLIIILMLVFSSGCDENFFEVYPYPRHYMCFDDGNCYVIQARYVNEDKKCFGSLAFTHDRYPELMARKDYDEYKLYKVITKGSVFIEYEKCGKLND